MHVQISAFHMYFGLQSLSSEVFDFFSNMLQLGESKPWPEALTAITGNGTMTAQPLLNYFDPLIKWLEQKNQETDETLGWAKSWVPKGQLRTLLRD